MLEFKFDTQLLIEGHDLDEDAINDYITENLKGDCLLAVGDDELIKIHFHTNEPWQLLEYKFDTQLLIEGHDLDEDVINDYITENFKGDCLLAVGDDELIKIHYHTNEPWKVLEYCASLGEIYDVVIENMERQEQGLHG